MGFAMEDKETEEDIKHRWITPAIEKHGIPNN